MDIRIFSYQSPEYDKALELRTRILREPLGLKFTEAELKKDEEDIHFGLFDGDKIIACLTLTKADDKKIKMRQVADEIRNKWPIIEGIAIIQRIGRLSPGTPTTVIACTASHRNSGVFDAAKYGIDRLKEIVPVWKKEIGPGGEEWVEGHYHPKPGE